MHWMLVISLYFLTVCFIKMFPICMNSFHRVWNRLGIEKKKTTSIQDKCWNALLSAYPLRTRYLNQSMRVYCLNQHRLTFRIIPQKNRISKHQFFVYCLTNYTISYTLIPFSLPTDYELHLSNFLAGILLACYEIWHTSDLLYSNSNRSLKTQFWGLLHQYIHHVLYSHSLSWKTLADRCITMFD